jgi:hypothetical protein
MFSTAVHNSALPAVPANLIRSIASDVVKVFIVLQTLINKQRAPKSILLFEYIQRCRYVYWAL